VVLPVIHYGSSRGNVHRETITQTRRKIYIMNYSLSEPMKQQFTITIVILAAVILTGCLSQTDNNKMNASAQETIPEPSIEKPGDTSDISYRKFDEHMRNTSDLTTGMQSGMHETLPIHDYITIYLKENPTTGYRWNASVTSGLSIEDDTYVTTPVAPGIVGSGGMHYWLVKGTEKGNQTFSAIYKRSWEPETGEENRFNATIIVV
jgi:predicted secreted protein